MESDSSVTSAPEMSVGSAGSCVSSRLQEEYESLLKYALVTPVGHHFPGSSDLEDQGLTMDQTRLLRSSNPNPTPLPSTIPADPLNQNYLYSSSESEEPVKLPASRSQIRRISPPTRVNPASESVNTTENERARETSVQNRVFGSLPSLAQSVQTSNYSLDELDASPEEEPAASLQNLEETGGDFLTSTHDTDIVRLEGQLDEWNLALRQNILAELTQIKLKLLQQQKCRIIDEREKNNERMGKLTLQNEELKELVANCDRTIVQKDSIIANLTTSLSKQKKKEGLVRSFQQWKLRHCDEKREEFCCQIASDYYMRRLVSRAFGAWKSVQENKWKERVERACQNRAQEVCEQLTRDYEEKVAGLQRQLGSALVEIASLQADREQFEERMKKGFMRGVCALNLEAMTMFKEEEASKENVEPPTDYSLIQPMQRVPVHSEHPLPNVTTAPHLAPRPGSKQILVKLSGVSNGSRPTTKTNHKPETVIVERHSGPTHHAPLRSAPRKHKPRSNLSVKIVE